MHAVIFDIDGTLLDSNSVDDELYLAAVQRVLGTVRIRGSWSAYAQVTDSGMLSEIMRDNGIRLESWIVETIRNEFVEDLRRHIEQNGPFVQIPGARQFVNELEAATEQACAYATGGWSASARLKLESAGFPVQGVPLAACDDMPDRRQIMREALAALGSEFETVTYYGDGEWDRDAARSLGWHFMPVGIRLGGLTRYQTNGALTEQPTRTPRERSQLGTQPGARRWLGR
jgi:FMN phosphatase YigB (HAD superfamily)